MSDLTIIKSGRMPHDTSENPSFSLKVPGLQTAVDSTSLGTFKECPRKYYYSIVRGYQARGENVHLKFGLIIHESAEKYEQSRAAGSNHADALDCAVDFVLKATWEPRLGRAWTSEHKAKNRISAIRTVVWYLEQYGAHDSLQTVRLASSGRAAVELTFRFDSAYRTSGGEAILFCGHLDRLVEFSDKLFVSDIKTTGSVLGPQWFQSFTPGNQFSMYSFAGKAAFSEPIEGVIVDGIQVATGFSRFARGTVWRPNSYIEEWYAEQRWYLDQMEACAEASYWPQNDKSCGNYGGCPFAPLCARTPQARETWLKADYSRRIWNPLEVRGEV